LGINKIMYNVFSQEFRKHPSVLYNTGGFKAPGSACLDYDNFTPDAMGKVNIPSGTIVVSAKKTDDGSLYYRALPRAIVGTNVATNQKNIVLKQSNPSYIYMPFLVGDVLYSEFPSAIFTVTGSGTGSLMVNGYTYSFTTINATSAATAASEFANYFNNLTAFMKANLYVVANGADLYVYGMEQDKSYPIGCDTTIIQVKSNNTFSVTTMTVNTTPIGTIASINYADHTITLVANAAIAVPANAIIGCPYSEIAGVVVESIQLSETFPSNNLGLCSGGTMYRLRMPYIDKEIERALPQISFKDTF